MKVARLIEEVVRFSPDPNIYLVREEIRCRNENLTNIKVCTIYLNTAAAVEHAQPNAYLLLPLPVRFLSFLVDFENPIVHLRHFGQRSCRVFLLRIDTRTVVQPH